MTHSSILCLQRTNLRGKEACVLNSEGPYEYQPRERTHKHIHTHASTITHKHNTLASLKSHTNPHFVRTHAMGYFVPLSHSGGRQCLVMVFKKLLGQHVFSLCITNQPDYTDSHLLTVHEAKLTSHQTAAQIHRVCEREEGLGDNLKG